MLFPPFPWGSAGSHFVSCCYCCNKKKVAWPILLNLNAEGRRQGVKNMKSSRSFFSFPADAITRSGAGTPQPPPSSDCGGK